MNTPSDFLVRAFAALSLIVAALLPVGVYVAARGGRPRVDARRSAAIAAVLTAAWVGLTGLAAASGRLRFDTVPPTMMVVIAVMFALTLRVGLSGTGERLAAGLPLAALVGFQAFRLPLELLLHRSYTEGVMPVQMSYSGLNFDIVTGATALVLGVLLAVRTVPLGVVRAWNWLGTALLTNIVVVALLSTPSPVRVFRNEPANVWIADAPFVWLPAVLVAAALLGHVLVFRRLRMEAAARRQVRAPVSAEVQRTGAASLQGV